MLTNLQETSAPSEQNGLPASVFILQSQFTLEGAVFFLQKW